MVFLTLAGLWALAFGRITLTRSLSLHGRRARYYGVALLVAALILFVFGGPIADLLARLVPGFAGNGVLSFVINMIIVLAIILGLVPLFREKPPGVVVP